MGYVLDLNEKKLLYNIYNDINKEIYGNGVIELRIEQKDDIIIFIVKNQRVRILVTLEQGYSFLKKMVDQALFEEFKLRLKKRVSDNFSFEVVSVFRDFDPEVQKAYTLIIIK